MSTPAPRRRPARRPALGALFVLLTALFAGITAAAWSAEVLPVAIAAAVIGAWLLSMAIRSLRSR